MHLQFEEEMFCNATNILYSKNMIFHFEKKIIEYSQSFFLTKQHY